MCKLIPCNASGSANTLKHSVVRHILSAILLAASWLCHGQRYTAEIENIRVIHGLPDNAVYSFFQDDDGFMWVGFQSGLARFDGYDFTLFEIKTRDTEASPVIEIVRGEGDQLWVATRGAGLHQLDRKTLEISPYQPPEGEPAIGKQISDIMLQSSGNLWGVTEQGVFVQKAKSPASFSPVHFTHNDRLVQDVTEIFEDKQHRLIIATASQQLFRTREPNPGATDRLVACEPLDLQTTAGNFFNADADSEIWMSAWNQGIFVMNDTGNITHLRNTRQHNGSVSSNQITDITEDKNGNIWVATYDRGLNILPSQSPSGDYSFINYRSAPRHSVYEGVTEAFNDLTDYNIRKMFFDRTGVLWLATFNSGILKVQLKNETFRYYQQNTLADNTLAHRDVSFPKITRDGSLWIGTWGGGLHYLSPEEASKANPSYQRFFPVEGDSTSISFPRVFPVLEDRDNNLWLGTNGGGLNLLTWTERTKDQPRFRRFQHDSSDSNSINHNSIRSIFEDREGVLWVGTNQGLNKYIPNEDRFARFAEGFLIYEIDQDSQGKLWLGTLNNGLIVWNPELDQYKKFTDYQDAEGNLQPLRDVHHVLVDSSDIIWLGGRDGFFSFNPETEVFRQFTEAEGIPTRQIESMQVDQKGRFWIGTWESGLYSFEPETEQFTHFKMTRGSLGNSFTQGSSQAADGTLYFGSRNGFYSFHPDSVKAPQPLSEVYITAVQGGDSQLDKAAIHDLNTNSDNSLQFGHKNRTVSISFSGLTFDVDEPVRYAYYLSDIDDSWRITNIGEHRLTYSNLYPGTYTFQVKAILGTAEGPVTSVTIIIHPPWWQTWWSYLIFASLCLFIAYRIRLYRKAKLKREQDAFRQKVEREKEERLQQIKLDFFTNISHEIKTPLTLIKAPVENMINSRELSSKNTQYAALIKSNTERLLRLTNQLLDYRKVSLNQMPVKNQNLDLVALIEDVCILFRELASGNGILFSFHATSSALSVHIDKDKSESIIFNLLTNAFKHTRRGDEIKVVIDTDGALVTVKVIDTGSGIQDDKLDEVFSMFYSEESQSDSIQKGTGIGLALVKELTTLLNGKVTVTSKKSVGTTFTVSLSTEVMARTPGNKEVVFNGSMVQAATRPDWEEALKVQSKLPALLVVEDDRQMNDYISMQFSHQYKVIQAENGVVAYEHAVNYSPELIITDLMMPESDGIELCEKLKSNLATSHIPIVMLTAKARDEDRLRGVKTGADAYITKPFSLDLLTVTVEKLIESRRLLRRKYGNSLEIEPASITITSIDEDFIRSILHIIDEYMDNSNFSVEQLARETGVSTPQLYRKVKAITGLAPNEFIRDLRLKKAAIFLKETGLGIAEISYKVGFSNPKYFSRCFRQQFGSSPKAFRSDNQPVVSDL